METQEQIRTSAAPSSLLRRAIQANGIFSGVSGCTLLVAAEPLAPLLGIPAPIFLQGTGLILCCYGIALFVLAAQQRINRNLVLAVILLDVIWVIDSIVVLLTGWLPLTTTGAWVIGILALIVAGFAEAQYLGLRRMY